MEISIIVPVYNVEQTLKKCFESITKQTFLDYEVIFVDDGSTDASGMLCDEYSKLYKNVKVIHKINGGLSSARNLGLKAAKGKYVLFIDSDDWISKDMLYFLYKRIRETNSDIAICGIIVTDGQIEKPMEWYSSDIELEKNAAINELLLNRRLTSHAWNKLYRRDIISKIPFPEGKLYEDIRMMHKVFEHCKKVAISKEQCYFYYQHSNTITTTIKIENKIALIKALESRLKDIKELYPKIENELISQIGVSYSLMLVQNRFNKNDIAKNKEVLKEYKRKYLTSDVQKIINKTQPKQNYYYFILARILGIRSNYIYRLLRGKNEK